MTLAFRTGSAIDTISAAGGSSDGLETTTSDPSPRVTWYSTDGAVEMSERSNSRSSRSRTISMWSRPRKATPEPEPECPRGLGLVGEAGVVELQLLERLAKLGELVAVDGIQAREDHRFRLPVPLERFSGAVPVVGDRLTGASLPHILDACESGSRPLRAPTGRREGCRAFGSRSRRPRGWCRPA